MKKDKDLKILPSKVILSDENIVLLDELKEEEKAEIQLCICKNVSKQISNYYSSRKEEWAKFVSVMT